MRKGFIFNYNRCVNCGACSAACVLENGWTVSPRKIFTFNEGLNLSLPHINLSLACNHCEKAVCLEGCPTSAYYRDTGTGAVIIDNKKCIGCKYCQWNCPYDAPKLDQEKKTIGKCNLCFSLLKEGGSPACANGCPTDALSYGEINDYSLVDSLRWFPDKKLNPALKFTSANDNNLLRIIPDSVFEKEGHSLPDGNNNISGEWSLAAFSFLTILSVASVVISLLNGRFPDRILLITLIILAGLTSLSHLGKKLRAWRAIINLKRSPLSREIAFYLLFSIVSLSAIFTEVPGFLFAAAILGLLLLLAIDSVYLFSDNRKSMFLHSGQTFISGLLIISFFYGNAIPFMFLASLKIAASIFELFKDNVSGLRFKIRFVRIALLLVSGGALISGILNYDQVIPALFLTGELIDRILFYFDFDPLNIKKSIKFEERYQHYPNKHKEG